MEYPIKRDQFVISYSDLPILHSTSDRFDYTYLIDYEVRNNRKFPGDRLAYFLIHRIGTHELQQ
jgi:hypothetical protein